MTINAFCELLTTAEAGWVRYSLLTPGTFVRYVRISDTTLGC